MFEVEALVVLELPEGSRVEYQLEVVRGGQRERINDPLNPRLAHSPVGSSSVCYAHGHEIPDWTVFDPEARPGSLVDMVVPSRALRRDCPVTLYLPARFRRADPGTRYPLLIVHDGGDYLGYAAAKTVLDNLIHRLDMAETIVAFTYPGDRLTEYANSAAHARYLTAELLPRLEAEFPLVGTPLRDSTSTRWPCGCIGWVSDPRFTTVSRSRSRPSKRMLPPAAICTVDMNTPVKDCTGPLVPA